MIKVQIYILLYYCLGFRFVKGEDCASVKENFANASAEFTLCASNNSRPITFCEKCVDSYVNVLDSFQNMSKIINNGTSCLDTLINQDRLQIIKILYDNSVDLWSRAKCYECFDNDNGTQSTEVSNKTKHFQLYYENFRKCKEENTEHICTDCLKDYEMLDNYYKRISNINEKIGVCMDLVDIMNTTWNYWSTNCCKYRRHDEYIFIGSSVAVLILTVVFYLVVQFYKEKNAPTIIQQSRFYKSLSLFKD